MFAVCDTVAKINKLAVHITLVKQITEKPENTIYSEALHAKHNIRDKFYRRQKWMQ